MALQKLSALKCWTLRIMPFLLCFFFYSIAAKADWMQVKYRYPERLIWNDELIVNQTSVGSKTCETYDNMETCWWNPATNVLRLGENVFDFTVKTTTTDFNVASTLSIGLSAYISDPGVHVEVCRQGNVIPNSGINFQDFYWDGNEFNWVCRKSRTFEPPVVVDFVLPYATRRLDEAVASLDAATILENFTERIRNMSFDELNRLAIDNDFPGELKGLLEWLKRIGLDLDAKRQAFAESKAKIQSEIDELAEKLEDIAESEGIPKEAIALPDQVESLQPDEEQQKSKLGLLANEIVNRFIDDVSKSWQAGDRIKILNLASEFLEQIISLQAQVSARSLAEPLEAQAVQSAIFRGAQFLYDMGCAGNGCLSRDLWFKDTPVPTVTRRMLKEAIRPAFGDAGIQIEKGMRAWAGQLNPTQQYVLGLVDAMGPAALALAGETDALASALYRGLQATAADLAVAVRDVAMTGGSWTPGLGDANDLCEVTTGREFCGTTGRTLSFSERTISAAGFLIGTGQAWRAVGSKLMNFFVGTERTAIVEAGMKVLESAKNLGWKGTKEAFEDLGHAVTSLEKEGRLPASYLTKSEAKFLGWDPSKGNLAEVAPGRKIGGDAFGNRQGQLPTDKTYLEADLGYRGGYRGTERIVYSSDGKKIYLSNDHYETFTELK